MLTSALEVNGSTVNKDGNAITEAAESTPFTPLTSWTVDQLKEYLKEHHVPVTGVKSELVKRVKNCVDILFYEEELNAKTFQQFHSSSNVPPSFDSIPKGPWSKENFPLVKKQDVMDYLVNKGGYTKNYRTGVRLCQCGHLYDIEMCAHNNVIYMRGKCRPTMRSKPPFYFLFIMVDINAMRPTGENCFCAAGASQSCVHISAMLLTVAEVTATACTSIRWAWSKPSGAKAPAVLASELDFGIASSEGHFP